MKFTPLDTNKYIVEFDSEVELQKFKDYIFPPKTLKAGEVMKMLKITRQTLCHYVKAGLIKVSSRYDGGQYQYDYDSVMKILNK